MRQATARFRWPWWSSGALALVVLLACTVLPALALALEAGGIDWQRVLGNPYTQRVIRFSFMQACLSTLLALGLALPVALALAHTPRFPGRHVLVNVLSLSLVIPTIVAIFGIVAVYGRTGWFNTALAHLGLPEFSLYGLNGILLAHVFFNMPLAVRVLLINLEGIPAENWRLARQLGLRPPSVLRFVEWPAIRGQLPGLALLIFTLCFTSFAIVMTLGGGPRATTIEVAIYQALRFDFDIALAVALGAVQLLICVVLMVLSGFTKHAESLRFDAYTAPHHSGRAAPTHTAGLWDGAVWGAVHGVVIVVASAFVLLPLIALLVSAFNPSLGAVLTHAATLKALFNTTVVALASGLLSLALGVGLLISVRHLRVRLGFGIAGQLLQLSGNLILVLPPLVLGTGLFLLLRPYADVFSIALVLVVLINSLMALPFVLRILEGPMMHSAQQNDKLVQSLAISGIARWRLIDWPQLKRPIGLCLAIATTLSAGDLSVIALFGSERVRTLPLLLYQRMGSYRLDEAAVTAGLLLLLCLILFLVIQAITTGRLPRAFSGPR